MKVLDVVFYLVCAILVIYIIVTMTKAINGDKRRLKEIEEEKNEKSNILSVEEQMKIKRKERNDD